MILDTWKHLRSSLTLLHSSCAHWIWMKICLVFHIPPLKFYQACLGLFRGNITASLTLGPKAVWCKFIIFLLWLQDGFSELPFRPELSEDVHRACSDTSGFRVSGVFLLQQGELLTCSAFSCRIRTLLPTVFTQQMGSGTTHPGSS